MKIEMLDNSRIKVTLTVEDLIYHNLKPEKLSPKSPGLQKFLFGIMENVRRETGFNPYKGTVAIEAVQSQEGIVLYISGITEKPAVTNVTVRGKEKNVRVYARKNVKPVTRYVFDDFSHFCDAMVLLDNQVLNTGRVYEYEKCYYLFLGECEGYGKAHSILSEYCTDYGTMVASESFLSEHGTIVAKDETLVSMVQGLRKLNEE